MTEYIEIDGVRCLRYDEKHRVHAELAAEHGLQAFVECGTNLGDSTFAALKWADMVYTVEANPEYARHAATRLTDEQSRRVAFYVGTSRLLLPVMLSRVDRPALIYLDTHDCADGRSTTRDELDIIAHTTGLADCIVLIDDVRLLGKEMHPTVEEIVAMGRWDVCEQDDQLLLVPR